MRILMIHNQYRQPGGEDKAFALETALLRERGHDVETIIFSNDAVETTGLGRIGAVRKAIYNPESKNKVAAVIGRFRPDVVHVHNLFFAASPSILDAAKEGGVPVLMTLHNYRLICCNAFLLRDNQPCERCTGKTFPLDGIRFRCYRDSAIASTLVTLTTGIHKRRGTWVDAVSAYVVLTDFARSRFENSSLAMPAEKFIVKPNFVPDPGRSAAIEHSPREDYFLFAGRISKEKGVYPLLETFRRRPESRLRLAGDGPEREMLQQQFADCANITFLGPLPGGALMDQMRRCLALVFPSLWYEGLPFVILEAFSLGTPVIASNLGSMTEMIEDGRNGLHFAAGNADAFSAALDRFPSLAPQLYSGARETYLERYHPDGHYRHIMQIYSQLIPPSHQH